MNELTKTKTNKMKFECCNRQQNSNEFIICSQCLKKYHYACIATTTTLQYKEVTNDFKANWLCPECNRPRAGLDNSNTPVRAAATLANDKHDSSLNVTVRNKQKFTKASDTDSSLTSADVRQIIIVQELVNPGSNGLPVSIAVLENYESEARRDSGRRKEIGRRKEAREGAWYVGAAVIAIAIAVGVELSYR
ncbi:unnamed protein product, partial [Brenthis ino]